MSPMWFSEVAIGLFIQITLVVIATFALDRWLSEARLKCHLWTASFVGVLSLVLAALLLPHYRFVQLPSIESRSWLANFVVYQVAAFRVLGCVWAVGTAMMLARRIVVTFTLARFLRRDCRPITAAQLEALPLDTIESIASMRVLVSDSVETPFCWQFHRPTIVVPRAFLLDTALEQRHVLLHEFEHLRMHHPLQHFLQGVCVCLFWFHPLIWMAGRRAELVREFLCDEFAARAGGRVSCYLMTMAKFAERGRLAPSCVLSFGRSKSALRLRGERLVEIANGDRPASHFRQLVAWSVLPIVVLLASQFWLPVNALASSRSTWSPWPSWTASTLHDFGIQVRDFETFDEHHGLHHLLDEEPPSRRAIGPTRD